jgi:hypothetical protein
MNLAGTLLKWSIVVDSGEQKFLAQDMTVLFTFEVKP